MVKETLDNKDSVHALEKNVPPSPLSSRKKMDMQYLTMTMAVMTSPIV